MTEGAHEVDAGGEGARVARPPAGRGGGGRVAAGCALAVVGVACLLGAGVALAKDAIATSVARDRLRERGVECDERFAASIAWSLDEVVIAPAYCTLGEGPVESVELIDPVRVALEGGEPAHVDGGAVRAILRGEPPAVRAGGFHAALAAIEVPERVGMIASGLARLAGSELPATELASLEIARHGTGAIATLAGVHADGASPLGVRVDRVSMPALAGPLGASATAALRAVEARATSRRVEMEGDLEVDAALPILGALRQSTHLVLIGEGLDGAEPRWELRAGE